MVVKLARGIRQKTKNYLLARNIDTRDMVLVGIQHSRRTQRPGKTKYFYHYNGTKDIYFNRNPNASYYIPQGFDQAEMNRFYDIFILEPLTQQEQDWLARNDIKLV